MEKGFFATDFIVYLGKDYVKVDLFEQEPVTDADGKVVLQKGVVQRITLPLASARKLNNVLDDMLKGQAGNEKK